MLKNAYDKAKEDGFTLIELLIVIVIIGILAAIAIPVFLSQAQAARNASVDSDTRNAASKVAQEVAVKGFPTVAADITALENKLTKSNGNQLKIASGANGNYTVTGWNDDAEKYSVVFASATGQFTADKTKDGVTAGGGSSTVQASCLINPRPQGIDSESAAILARPIECTGQVDIWYYQPGVQGIIGTGNIKVDNVTKGDTSTVFWTWTSSSWTGATTVNAGGYLYVGLVCKDVRGDMHTYGTDFSEPSKPGTTSGYLSCPGFYGNNQEIQTVFAGSNYNPDSPDKRVGVIWKKS